MIINTNITTYESAISELATLGVSLKIINGGVYKLAQSGKPNIVLCNDANKIDGEFPHIKFVGPNCKFPNYNYALEIGFNSILRDMVPPSKIKSNAIFLNLEGVKNKIIIKKIESLGIPLKVIGNGFGISQINPLTFEDSYAFYKSAEMCIATHPIEIYKILYLGKPCLTPFDFPFCTNIKDIGAHNVWAISPKEGQIEFAEGYSWTNIFNKIMVAAGEKELCRV